MKQKPEDADTEMDVDLAEDRRQGNELAANLVVYTAEVDQRATNVL